MPSEHRVEALIASVEQGRMVEAIEEFYAESATMQENLEAPRSGRETLLAHERRTLAAFKEVAGRCIRPALVVGDYVVINWLFEFTGKDGAKRQLNELAYQRWQADLIVEERFYYNPAQIRG